MTSKWTLSKKLLEDTLLKPSKYSKKGLLLEHKEFAGVIEFENNNCRIVDEEIVCDKVYVNHSVMAGSKDTVITPNAKVNFHTHPLHCYVDGNVIWGWPSGEDMAQCIRFAQNGNLYHIIFTLEGTYVINVNKQILNIDSKIIDTIETIFKLTHKYRWYKNMEDSTSLTDEFKAFLRLSQIKCDGINDPLELWMCLVNNFKLIHCENYTNINIKSDNKNLKLFKTYLYKNKSFQYNMNSEDAYTYLKQIKTSEQICKLIKMPNNIHIKL